MLEIRWKDKTLWDIWWDFTLVETGFTIISSMITNLKWQEFNIVKMCFQL